MKSWKNQNKTNMSFISHTIKSYSPYTHTHNEKAGSDHHCLHSHIKIHGELDPKVVGIRECLPKKSCPLFADLSDADFIHGQNLQAKFLKCLNSEILICQSKSMLIYVKHCICWTTVPPSGLYRQSQIDSRQTQRQKKYKCKALPIKHYSTELNY